MAGETASGVARRVPTRPPQRVCAVAAGYSLSFWSEPLIQSCGSNSAHVGTARRPWGRRRSAAPQWAADAGVGLPFYSGGFEKIFFRGANGGTTTPP